MKEKKITKIQNLFIGSVSSFTLIGLYTSGVNLSRKTVYHLPIYFGSTVISYISPFIIDKILVKAFSRYNNRKKVWFSYIMMI